MGDHLETVDGEERPREWLTFKHQLIAQYKDINAEESPIYTDAERYIRAALLALRGSGRAIDLRTFTKAFRFGLRMKYEDSIDQIVRDNILESRPTNIQKFKDILTFRHLKETVEQVEAKIKDGERVAAEY